jgi:menaquinol-cytochrome c reductase iron-sulfur subunit
MQNKKPSTLCGCQSYEAMTGKTRRGFFEQAAAVLLGCVAFVVPAVTGLLAFLNPLRQKSQGGQFMRLTTLDSLPEDGTPRKIPVVADRTDAWNRFPAEPIGAVFLRRVGGEVKALQVICPHAGCSIGIQSAAEGPAFLCPCHIAHFDIDGKRTDATSPSPRDMDSLDVEVRNTNEVWVKFQTFRLGTPSKIAQA